VGVIFLTHTVDAVVPRRFTTCNTILLECGNLDLYSACMQLDTWPHSDAIHVCQELNPIFRRSLLECGEVEKVLILPG